MVILIFLPRQLIWIGSLQIFGDRQTLCILGHVGFDITSMSISHPSHDMIPLIFGGLV
jgi:hypothetical protein